MSLSVFMVDVADVALPCSFVAAWSKNNGGKEGFGDDSDKWYDDMSLIGSMGRTVYIYYPPWN